MKGLRAMYVTAVNLSSSPVTIDAAGRQISPGEWGTADLDYRGAQDALDAELIRIVDAVAEDATPIAVDAQRRTVLLTARADGLNLLDDDALADLAGAAGVPIEGQSREDLVAAVAPLTDVDVPDAAPPAPAPDNPPAEEAPPAEAAAPEETPAAADPPPAAESKPTSRRRRAAEGTE